jgi:hypothetical protein
MAGITLAQAEAHLTLWLAASSAVASSQSYEIGDRKLTRADAAEIREQIEFWDRQVKRLDANASGRSRTSYVVPE